MLTSTLCQLICFSESLRVAISYISSLICMMVPTVLATTARQEGTAVTQRCKATSASQKFCRSKASKMFYCKICLSECPNKKGQKLDKCTCLFCREVHTSCIFIVIMPALYKSHSNVK